MEVECARRTGMGWTWWPLWAGCVHLIQAEASEHVRTESSARQQRVDECVEVGPAKPTVASIVHWPHAGVAGPRYSWGCVAGASYGEHRAPRTREKSDVASCGGNRCSPGL